MENGTFVAKCCFQCTYPGHEGIICAKASNDKEQSKALKNMGSHRSAVKVAGVMAADITSLTGLPKFITHEVCMQCNAALRADHLSAS